VLGEVDPAPGWVNRAVSAAGLDAGREGEAGNGITHHLALAAADAADGITHEKDLTEVIGSQGGAAKVRA
jgi:hypothetical protein